MKFLWRNLALAAGLTATGALAIAQTPAPVPQPSLDDLIPQSAVEDPEAWAADGVEAPSQLEVQSDPVPIEAEPAPNVAPNVAPNLAPNLGPNPDRTDPAPASFDLDAMLTDLAIPVPDPIEPDPQAPSFADIAAPDLVELPELAEFDVSDTLVLAFPADRDAFPEETDFVARFRALSSIDALQTGEETIPQLAARARSDEELLFQLLRSYGYYDGEVIRQLSGGRRNGSESDTAEAQSQIDSDPKVRFDILPGPRYAFGKIDLGPLDSLADPDGADLAAAFAIKPGDPVNADRIVARQTQLRTALAESGYPFADLGEPELLIDHARIEGDLSLPVDPNGKFAFGQPVSSDPAFLSDRHLQRIARFEPGEIYQQRLQADLRNAILATGLVSSVVITPRAVSEPEADEPGIVALDIDLERAPLRTVSGAVGYGTEDGFKLEAAWEHRNLFPPEGSLRLRGILGTREQLASVTYRRNNFRDRDQILTIDAYASDIETEAVDARTVALRGSFERVSNLLFQKPLSWQLGAEVLYTDERNRVTNGVSRPRQTYLIGGVFGSATIDASDDLLDPKNGYRLTGFLAPEVSRSLGEQSFYVRAQMDASVYRDTGRVVLAGRARAATIQGADPIDIAPSRRLYAGGGGSVRGYGFQGIGPRNDFGEPTGGGALVEAAIEARIQTGFLDGAVEVVPFFDLGSVSSGASPDFEDIRYGAGLGIRYKTSFGPIRVDVGVPLNPTQFDAPVVVYVSLGQAF